MVDENIISRGIAAGNFSLHRSPIVVIEEEVSKDDENYECEHVLLTYSD